MANRKYLPMYLSDEECRKILNKLIHILCWHEWWNGEEEYQEEFRDKISWAFLDVYAERNVPIKDMDVPDFLGVYVHEFNKKIVDEKLDVYAQHILNK